MKVILIILLALATLRLILPYVILYFVNKALAKLKDYKGRAEKISIKLYGASLKLKELVFNKIDNSGETEIPFFRASEIDLSFQWIALFHKSFIGTVKLDQPQLDFIKEIAEPKSSSGAPFNLKSELEKVLPFTIDIEFKN